MMDTNTVANSCIIAAQMQGTNYVDGLIGVLIWVDIFPTILSVFANMILIMAIVRTPSLRIPSNTLLCALCVSDLLVGLVSQPIFLAVLFKVQLGQEPDTALLSAFFLSNIIFNGMSFVLVLYITIDRYVAICHPFPYQAKVTCKRYIILVVATWFYKVIPPFIGTMFYLFYYAIFTVFTFLIVFACYKKIYAVIAQKSRHILRLGAIGIEHREVLIRNREDKSKAYTIVILLVVLVFSYIPILGVTISIFAMQGNINIHELSPNMLLVLMFAIFFLNLTSVINPLVYCIRMKSIKVAATKLLFNGTNRVSTSA